MALPTSARRRMLATTALIGAGLLTTSPAFAQDAGESTGVSEVIVTGSRIPRPEIDVLQPTVVTTETDIDNSGLINLGNVIRESPLFESYNQTNGDRASANTGDSGVTFANLYNLGAQRTLTLVNGKRVVGAASPSGSGANGLQVDISSIPTGLVSRIETVSVGGAPVYGSDAIAGTVNIILKDDFDGLEIEGDGGITEHGDGENGRAQVLFGKNFDDGKGNIVMSAAYSRQESITAQDRDFEVPFGFVGSIENPQLNIPVTGGSFIFSSRNGRPSNFFGIGGVDPATGAPVGFFTNASGQPLTFDAGGNLVPFETGEAVAAFVPSLGAALVTVPPADDSDSTRTAADIVNPSERIYLNGMGRYDFTDHVRGWTRFSYTQTNATFQGSAPFSSIFGTTLVTGPQMITLQNPFLRPAVRAFAAANPNPFTGSAFFLSREYNDVTTGLVEIDQNTWTVQGGLTGDFQAFGRTWNWDLTGSHGRTDRTNTSTGVIESRLGFAYDAVYANSTSTTVLPTPMDLDISHFTYDEAANVYRETGTGNIITCRVRVTGGPAGANPSDISSCAPYNPFGAQNPEDALDYLRGQILFRSEIQQTYAQGNVSGALFDLPAGPLQMAAGFEFRHEEASFDLDAGSKTGIFVGGSTGASVEGSFDTKEVYAEIRAPLLDGAMTNGMIDKLELEGAVRLMDNSQAGTDTAWTIGGRLAFTPDIMVRGNITRSVRQPAVAELFSGVEPRFQSITDPCAVGFIDSGPNPSGRRANCIAAVIASGLASNEAGAATFLSTFTSPLVGIPGTFAGNPNLNSETADSWTVGVVLTPRFIPGLMLTADWISIEISDEIAALDGGAIASNCFDAPEGLDNPFCSGVTRNPGNFRIVSFESFYGNVDRREFAGLTVNGRYSFDLAQLGGHDGSDWGRVSLQGTLFMLDHDREGRNNLLSDSVGSVGREKYRAQGSIDWQKGRFGANWQTRWYASSELDPNTPGLFFPNEVDAYWVHDVALRYDITPAAQVHLVVNNVFDTDPPFNSFSYQFDRLGRRFLAGFKYRF